MFPVRLESYTFIMKSGRKPVQQKRSGGFSLPR